MLVILSPWKQKIEIVCIPKLSENRLFSFFNMGVVNLFSILRMSRHITLQRFHSLNNTFGIQ